MVLGLLVGAFLTLFSARIIERTGARVLITGGLALMTASLVILGVVPSSTPIWALAGLMVPVGLAGPLIMPPVTAVLLNSVPAHRAGTASGVFNTSRQIGGPLAIAVFGALLADRATFMPGLRTSLLLAAGVALAAAVASLRLKSPRGSHDVPGAVVLVVDLDVGVVLLADGDLCPCLAFLVVVMTVMRGGLPSQNPARGPGMFASVRSLAGTLASRSGPARGARFPGGPDGGCRAGYGAALRGAAPALRADAGLPRPAARPVAAVAPMLETGVPARDFADANTPVSGGGFRRGQSARARGTMTTTQSTSRNKDQAQDRDRELERTIRDALVLAVGKRAANRALRHARNKAHDAGQRQARLCRWPSGRLRCVARLHLAPAAGTKTLRGLSAEHRRWPWPGLGPPRWCWC